ncbi:uncharacterized protein [Clytia hemisphaerica]|uniref:uncharacterized protein n=1 Tax=Clytia hemisphaerica TaxID=252671 RepID=UPI0034D67869
MSRKRIPGSNQFYLDISPEQSFILINKRLYMPSEHSHTFRSKRYHRKKMEKREKRRKVRDEKKKKASFKTIGLYVTIGNHFIKSIKRGHISNDTTTTFDDLFTPRDSFVVEDEKELFKACVTPRPPMSNTMRKIILDLNQCHLMDKNSNTIQEEREESEQPPLNENQPLKRAKWNNFVDQQIISRQRFLNTFTTDLAFRKEHLKKKNKLSEKQYKRG